MLLHEVREGMAVTVTLSPTLREHGTAQKIGTKGEPHVRKPIPDAVLVVCPSHPKGIWVLARSLTPYPEAAIRDDE